VVRDVRRRFGADADASSWSLDPSVLFRTITAPAPASRSGFFSCFFLFLSQSVGEEGKGKGVRSAVLSVRSTSDLQLATCLLEIYPC
jgi:hypothetical protein